MNVAERLRMAVASPPIATKEDAGARAEDFANPSRHGRDRPAGCPVSVIVSAQAPVRASRLGDAHAHAQRSQGW